MIISGNNTQNLINGKGGVAKKQSPAENKDMVTLGSTNSTPDFMALKELASQSAGVSGVGDAILKCVKGVLAGVGGVIGGAAGLAIGTLYAGTIFIPLLVAAGNISEYAPSGAYGQEAVKQLTSPVRWAVGGAKAGANAVLNSF